AVNKREPLSQIQPSAQSRTLLLVEFEQRKIDATRHHCVMHIATSQTVPFFDDGPDTLSQRNDGIRGREDPSFSRFRNTITQTTFGPVLRIDVFFSHQAAD